MASPGFRSRGNGRGGVGVEPRVLDRTQVPWATTTLASGEPPDSPRRQSTIEGRAAIHRISALVWTQGKVIELAGKICRQPVSMLIDAGSIGNYVSAQTCTTLGIRIEEEPTNEELQLADGSPLPTQGQVKLQTKSGKNKNVIWSTVFPHMQKQVILGMPWLVQEDPDISWSHQKVTMVRGGKWLNLLVVKVKPEEPTIRQVDLCSATQVQWWFTKGKIDQAFLGVIWNVKELKEEDVAMKYKGKSDLGVVLLWREDLPKEIEANSQGI